MITCKDMNIWVGNRELLHHLNFTVNPLQKVALVGSNGSGKTTLLNTFKLSAEQRKLQFSDSLQINPVAMAWVEQEVPNTTQPAIEYVIQGDHQYAYWNQQLDQAMASHNNELIATACAKLDDMDAWSIKSRAALIMTGLGFEQDQLTQPVNTLSGGWRIRLNLARALLVPSELLLLDEPTNHLDIDAIYWLENYLQQYKGTIVFISHDQEFMDNLASNILHIDNGTIYSYTGNYTSFINQRATNLEHQEKAYQQQQKHIQHIQSFITRFKAKAKKAKQAQSRVKMLEKMAKLDPVVTRNPFTFEFKDGGRLPSVLATIRHASIGYLPGQPVLTDVNFSLMPEMRIGLLGLNGAGKSTLIKAFAGELGVLDNTGVIELNELVKLGYFNQYVVDKLDLHASPITLLKRLDDKLLENEARKFLGTFNFTGDKVFETIENFSGGEKSRLALALIVYQRPNLLLLDEPTNHLDLEMRQALASALQTFNGTLIVVSHDRFLLANVVDEFYLVSDGKVQLFDEDLEGYHQWVMKTKAERRIELQEQATATKAALAHEAARQAQLTVSANSSNQTSNSSLEVHHLNTGITTSNTANDRSPRAKLQTDTRLARELKRQLQPLTSQQNKLHQQIEQLKAKLAEIEQAYMNPDITSVPTQLKQLSLDNAQYKEQLEAMEEEWLMIEMEIEEATEAFVAEHCT